MKIIIITESSAQWLMFNITDGRLRFVYEHHNLRSVLEFKVLYIITYTIHHTFQYTNTLGKSVYSDFLQ